LLSQETATGPYTETFQLVLLLTIYLWPGLGIWGFYIKILYEFVFYYSLYQYTHISSCITKFLTKFVIYLGLLDPTST